MAEPVKVKRIKVRRTHTRKLFFEKTLMDWKDSTEDRNFRSVLFRAYLNLRNYPLEIMSITELKSIKGIGELIATKLDAAWDCICSNYLSIPTLKQIKELRKGECLQFISSAPQRFSAPCVPDSDTLSNNLAAAVVQPAASTLTSKTTISPKKGRPRGPRKHARKVLTSDDAPSSTIHSTNILDTSPLRARKRPTNKVPVASTATNKKPRKREPKYSMMEEAASAGLLIMAPHGSFPCFASLADKPNISSAECAMRNPRGGVLQPSIKSNAQLSTFGEVTSRNNDDGMLSYYAFDFGKSEVLLLVDNREHRGGRAGRSICDHLRNMEVNFELRTLSIGDYVWIIRMKDGAEMMLDYIVERKTLDDMTQSIRSSRYKEQKQRLSNCGLRNVVYLVEGRGHHEKGIDQALSTTSLIDGFMVKLTHNINETAQFLHALTQRLIQKARTQNMRGISFESFQRLSKKTQRRTVKDVFTRMLTVCPRMTIEKATLVASRFPTFFQLTRFYESLSHEQRPMALAEAIPGIPKPLSKQLAVFFDGV